MKEVQNSFVFCFVQLCETAELQKQGEDVIGSFKIQIQKHKDF